MAAKINIGFFEGARARRERTVAKARDTLVLAGIIITCALAASVALAEMGGTGL